MKLRIDPTQIRFRLSEHEAEKLLVDKLIAEKLPLPFGGEINYLIKIDNNLNLNYENNHLILTVSNEALENLIKNPNKKGLSSAFQEQNKNIVFSLQIDMTCDFHC